ncbi:MAG: prephenate dehydratase [Acidobacteriota bacterium]
MKAPTAKPRKQTASQAKRPFRAAFQGELGAFSHVAIQQLFGPNAEPVPEPWFDQVFSALARGEVDAAVVPIENTLYGSVHQSVDLLLKHDFVITGETSVRVMFHVIAPPGVRFKDIRKVYSHPVALDQCLDFLAHNKQIEREAFYDSAGAVKMLMEQRIPNAAAIAGDVAATTYNARILKRGIEDDRQNYTRFFLLEPAGAKPRELLHKSTKNANRWKTSLVFTTRNVTGALFRALSAVALRDLDIAKIESRPLRGKPWEYLFYLDLFGHTEDTAVKNALAHLNEVADFLRVLGTYRAG